MSRTLNDQKSVERLDPGGMLAALRALPDQCRAAWDMARGLKLPGNYRSIDRIVIFGMGGSAISGDYFRALLARECAVPVFNVRGYDMPPYVDERTLVMCLIETAEGIEKIDEITSTPGVDAVYIGPTDLALALGLPPVMDNDEPKHVATVNRILEACKRHRIVPGIHTASSKFTQRYLDQGFQMVMLGTDRGFMSSFAKAEVGKLTGWTPLTPGASTTGGY